jgi:CheY-like chemotaxis protein
MPDGGRLLIRTANVQAGGTPGLPGAASPPAGPHVLLEVTDSGTGMDAATQAHLFEPFFTTKEPGKGTGLGLSTVYGIVEQSGGSMTVETEVGRGTTFRIYLPQVATPAAAVAEIHPAPATMPAAPTISVAPPSPAVLPLRQFTLVPPTPLRPEPFPAAAAPLEPAIVSETPPVRSETILLVEDALRVRAVVREILEMNGYNVLEARHGAEAIEISERHRGPIHLMVTDVVMPRMSGRELAQRLQPVRPDMRVLYMSGYTDDAIVRHGVLGAGMAFLSKPFTPDALALKVREVLEAAAADAPAFSRGVEPTVGAATGAIVQRAEDVGSVRRSRI